MTDIKKLQNLAIASLSRGRGLMQKALIESLIHIYNHGDRNALHNLVDGLKKDKANDGHLRQISNWLADFGGMVFDEDKDSPTYRSIIGWQGKEHIKENLGKAKENLWYSYKKPAKVREIKPLEFKGFNLDGTLKTVINEAKELYTKESAMDEVMRSKVKLEVSSETMQALYDLLDLLGIETILTETGEPEQKVA